MKKAGYVAAAALLGLGTVGTAQAHVFVGVNVGMPVAPVMAVAPVAAVPVAPIAPIAPIPAYAPPMNYYAPPIAYYAPPPVFAPSVAVGYWGGHPGWGYRHYGGGYWR